MKKILVVGSYGAGNVGDEAILESIKKELGKKVELKIATPHLPFSFAKIPFRLKTLRKLWESDFVLLGGGGLFTDSDSIKAIKIWGKTIWWSKFFGKKVFLYANSVGPFSTSEAKELAKKRLSKIDKLTVRDEISKKNLEKFGLKAEVFSDPVFLFEKKEKEEQKILAVSLRPTKENFDHKSFEKFLEKKEEKGRKIAFVAMEEKDKEIFLENYNTEKRVIFSPIDFEELLEFLAGVQRCVGMRLHFLIGACVAEKELFGISYSSKVKGLLEKLAVETVGLDFNFLETEKLFAKAKNLEKERSLVRKLNEEILGF